MVLNALSFDVEEWFNAEFARERKKSFTESDLLRESQALEATRPILALLRDSGVKATFFVLGEAAERTPLLAKEIAREGHEVASHGYSHEPLTRLSPAEFARELARTERAFRKAGVREKPRGFRAPTFSLNRGTSWALRVLERAGYEYDSSVFPAATGFYGVPYAPVEPYYPSADDPGVPASGKEKRKKGKNVLVEIPLTVSKIAGFRVPAAGGFYLRFFPLWFARRAIRARNAAGAPAVVYAHPWETFSKTPKLSPGVFREFVSYHGRAGALKKLGALVREFEFAPLKEIARDFKKKETR